MMYVFNTRAALMLTGKMILIPREAEGVVIEQYVPTSVGPIFQAAGNSKWLHQVTEEGKPVATSFSSLAIILPFVFCSASLGALGTDQYHRGDFWVLSGLLAAGITVLCKVVGGMMANALASNFWGSRFEVAQDIGLGPGKAQQKETA
jgi:hypothetical protein